MFSSRILPALFLPAALIACSDADQAFADVEPGMRDPPGVAQALSLGGRLEDQSDYERAIGCVVALRVTAEVLAPLTSGTDSREVRLINTAAGVFAERAEAAGGGNVAADVERGVAQNAADRSGQAQRALACANSLN